MNLWKSFKKWALRPEGQRNGDGTPRPFIKLKTEPEVVPVHVSMIGEPVTSFIASFKREPKRYKLTQVLVLGNVEWEFPVGERYSWMNGSYYTLLDTKTDKRYTGYAHDNEYLYAVYGLPFNLNHWELQELWKTFKYQREPARNRKNRIEENRRKRMQVLSIEREKAVREQFAEQFK